MARPLWNGSISFGLVTVPVELYTVVRSHGIRFKQLNRDTGAPVKQKRVDASTGEEVEYRDIVKGYEVADDRYVLVEPSELAQLDPDASRLICIHAYVEQDEIDPIYYDHAYYLAPKGETAGTPYRLLAEAMGRAGKVAVATFVMRNREYLAALRAVDGVLVLSTMHYADEVSTPSDLQVDLGEDAPLREREVAMAEQLIDSLVTEFDAQDYHDEHQRRVIEYLEAKGEGRPLEDDASGRDDDNVIDLMAALEQSLSRSSPAPEDKEAKDGGADGRSADTPPDVDYAAMTRSALYELAQDRDLPGRSSLSKAELVERLQRDDEQAGAA